MSYRGSDSRRGYPLYKGSYRGNHSRDPNGRHNDDERPPYHHNRHNSHKSHPPSSSSHRGRPNEGNHRGGIGKSSHGARNFSHKPEKMYSESENSHAGRPSIGSRQGPGIRPLSASRSSISSQDGVNSVVKNSSKAASLLDSSRIWAKLLNVTVKNKSERDLVLQGLPTPKYREKEFVDKFKRDMDELEEINSKMNDKFSEKFAKEVEYEKYNRFEQILKLSSQLKQDSLERIVNNEGIFGEI